MIISLASERCSLRAIVARDAFVTGGSGLLGGALLTELHASGRTVRALARSERARAVVASKGAVPIRGDLSHAEILREAMAGASVVFHVAGVNKSCSPDPEAMDRVNIEGTVGVIRAAAEAGVERVVYTSSVAAIGESEGTIANERTLHAGEYVSAYARSKHLAEVAALNEAALFDVDLVIVNPSSVQGPGRSTGSAEFLLRAINAKRPLLVDTTFSIVDIKDCTIGHINAEKYGEAGERYILSGSTISVPGAIDLLSVAIGREINPRWVSRRFAGSFGMYAARIAGVLRPSLGVCPELIATLLHGHRFDGSKASEELRFTYTTPDETISRTVEWFRDQRLIAGS